MSSLTSEWKRLCVEIRSATQDVTQQYLLRSSCPPHVLSVLRIWDRQVRHDCERVLNSISIRFIHAFPTRLPFFEKRVAKMRMQIDTIQTQWNAFSRMLNDHAWESLYEHLVRAIRWDEDNIDEAQLYLSSHVRTNSWIRALNRQLNVGICATSPPPSTGSGSSNSATDEDFEVVSRT